MTFLKIISYNIVRDRFEADSVNVMEIRTLVGINKGNFNIYIYISLDQSIRKPWKLSLGTTTMKLFVSHAGLWQTLEKPDDFEKYWPNATCNL